MVSICLVYDQQRVPLALYRLLCHVPDVHLEHFPRPEVFREQHRDLLATASPWCLGQYLTSESILSATIIWLQLRRGIASCFSPPSPCLQRRSLLALTNWSTLSLVFNIPPSSLFPLCQTIDHMPAFARAGRCPIAFLEHGRLPRYRRGVLPLLL